MSYFNDNNLEKYFKDKPLRGFYNEEHEYVATWYENCLSIDKSKTLVEVTLSI